MKRFKNILVLLGGVNEQDPALVRATALAASNQARLTLALCLEEFGEDGPGDELRQVIVDGLRVRLLALADNLRQRGLHADVEILFGRTFIEAIVRVLRHQHDLLIKTARGHGADPLFGFGSTDMHLLRKCPCPVWMIHPEGGLYGPAHAGGVLAAVDPDPDNATKQALSTMIMQLATSLSLLEQKPMHVVHAWHLPAQTTLLNSPWLKVPQAEIDRLAGEARRSHRNRFNSVITEFRPIVPAMQVHFPEGLPEQVIPRIARDHDIEVIVMATIARTGIPGLIIGNVAESVLGQVNCSVLAIKPADFVTPVAA